MARTTKVWPARIVVAAATASLGLILGSWAVADPTTAWTLQFGSSMFDEIVSAAPDASGNVFLIGNTNGGLFGTTKRGSGVFVTKRSPTGSIIWEKHIATATYESAQGAASAPDGSICIVGEASGGLFGTKTGTTDAFLLKLSQDGEVVWGKQAGSPQPYNDNPRAVAVDSAGDIIVVGSTTGRMFGTGPPPSHSHAYAAKYDPDGSMLWGKQIEADTDVGAMSVDTDASDNIYLAGFTVDLAKPRPEEFMEDSFLLKLDRGGSQLWVQQFGASDKDDFALSVAVGGDGSVYVGGCMNGVDEKTGQKQQALGGYAAKYASTRTNIETHSLSGSGLAYVNAPALRWASSALKRLALDGYVAKYTSTGTQVWMRSLSGSGLTQVRAVAVDGASNVYAAGSTGSDLFGSLSGKNDAFVVRYAAGGDVLWSSQFGTTDDDRSRAVAVDPASGRVYVTGHTYGDLCATNAGRADGFAIAYDSVGSQTSGPQPASPAVSPKGHTANSVEAISDGVKFEVSLEKNIFIEGEPVLATCSITNVSSTARRLAEPYAHQTVYCRASALDPNVTLDRGPHGDYMALPEDFGWLFQPGECHSEVVELGSAYVDPVVLPVGDYMIESGYGATKQMPTVWQGKFTAVKGPKFSVVKPDDEEKQAANDFVKALSLAHGLNSAKCALAATVFRALKVPGIGHRFAQYAGFRETQCYNCMQDTEKGYQALREYADAHGMVPFYGKVAIEGVGRDFIDQKDFASARKYWSRLPAGYNRQSLLARCDRLEEVQKKKETGQ
jgi:hypothetical protein